VPKARGGYRIGHGMLYDHMMLDGLEDAYEKGRSMGTFAEECAAQYQFSRDEQDAYALASVRRAQAAGADGSFAWEIAPVAVPGRNGETLIDRDEGPAKARPDKIPSLKPAFKTDGTITAASSSSINDGAAALVLMRLSAARALGAAPLARIVAHARHSQQPQLFSTAPVGAIAKLYQKTGWSTAEVDLFEVNEAFAAVAMAAMREHAIAHEKINIHGGACALGHPIGASGARILVTLIGALKKTGGSRGVAALCIGGGEALALGIEMM
jgi:acetyl-CoA C-acetyltransferase